MTADEEKAVLETVREILDNEGLQFRNLIIVLQQIQKKLRYLPKAAMIEVARQFEVSPANVYGVATFYNQFHFTPPGKCHVRMCMGTACHIKQGEKVLDQWKRRLEIEEGGRTEDDEYSLERVACVGACAMAPVSIIEDHVMGGMSPTKVDGILLQHSLEQEKVQRQKDKECEAGEDSGS